MQARRQGDPVEARKDAEGGDGGVDVEACGETGGDDERGDGGGREFTGVSDLWVRWVCLGGWYRRWVQGCDRLTE